MGLSNACNIFVAFICIVSMKRKLGFLLQLWERWKIALLSSSFNPFPAGNLTKQNGVSLPPPANVLSIMPIDNQFCLML